MSDRETLSGIPWCGHLGNNQHGCIRCTASRVLKENERLRAATRYRNTHDVRASRIDAALALHHESQTDAVPPDTICFECDCLWPCPTVKALEGKA